MNTTDSAVRLTHIPSGIVVTCQNEKSQLQNKIAAMRVLQAKLLERKRLEERAELDALKADGGSSWGNQMRSYVLHPYQMVKDLRTEYEVGNPAAVLDGDLDGFLEAGIGGAIDVMTTSGTVLATSIAQHWHNFWRGEIGDWILNRGLRIVMLLIAAVLAARFVTWLANRVTRRLDLGFTESDALVRSEATKHRQAVASVISWVSIVLIYVVVVYEVIDVLPVPVGALVGPAAVLGAALGFGAQRLVQDLLAGFFIIVEKQYGFGDLVELSMVGSPENAAGTVEDVTLRVTKLRSSEGEVFTVPNGNIVKSVNLSKDWARAVVDIPVPTSADLGRVNEVLHQECEHARHDSLLGELLLDEPTVMGVERIEVDTVTLRLVARTLPGKQFEAGRQLRVLVIRALTRAGIVTAADARAAVAESPEQ